MADAGPGCALTAVVSKIVFDKLSLGGEIKTLEIDEAADRRDGSLDAQKLPLALDICLTYRLTDQELVLAVVDHAVTEANKLLAPKKTKTPEIDSELMQRLRASFAADYVGEAHNTFREYLVRCWTEYRVDPSKFTSPYGTLMQSSGFGKSRLLHELAKMTATDDEKASTDLSIRVLYVCARNNAKSSGFPRATPKLMELLFDEQATEKSMTQILLKLLTYAQQHWAEVGTTWLELFTNPSADKAAAEAITLASTTDNPVQSESYGQLLVLVIDEARLLLDLKDEHGVSFFRLLRRALKTANQLLIDNEDRGGIFAVLVDTNSRVHDFTPPRHWDSSSRATEHEAEKMLFPPFVLTHTMDVLCRNPQTSSSSGGAQPSLFNYKASVIHEDSNKRWNSLLSMGRPLWKTYIQNEVSLESQQRLISKLAANCCWACPKNFVTATPKEPSLASEMLMQRIVDIGDIGEVVARIFLLLAMDETVAPSSVNKRDFIFAGQWCSVKSFLDLLIGTSPVVKMDGGGAATKEQQTEYEAWMKSWKDWQLSFSQFEDLLEEPTAEMLWLMLGRRAAGVLRRNQRGADLVIPMFRGDDISCILVQVKNREEGDECPASATTKLLPANGFDETETLSALHACAMICLYISLREEVMPAQLVVLTTKQKDQQDSAAQSSIYVLCLRGVSKRWQDDEIPWSFLSQGVSMQLSEIANSAWWDISARAQSDLKVRAASRYSELSTVFPDEELMESVEFSLPFSRYSRELQRRKQQKSEIGKRKKDIGKPKRPKEKCKKSRG